MRLAVFILMILLIASVQAQTPDAVNSYIERYKAIAMEEMNIYGIPASVTLAQGIHESGCGTSTLALKSNNHFGIKCHEEWCGQTYHHDDDAPQECFRVYNCPEESFRDHSEFLKCRSRYASLFTLDKNDYRAWARGLKAAGYATNPHYPDIIIKLIEDYNLAQYDKANSGLSITKTEVKINSEVQMIKVSLLQSNTPEAAKSAYVKPTKTSKPMPTEEKSIDFSKYTNDERVINGTRALVYHKEVPLVYITQKYNITLEQIYAYNDMAITEKFTDNALIYLEKKKADAIYYQYEVSEGETMHFISQKFAVQLAELIKRNGLTPGSEPLTGEIVVLRGQREYPLKYKQGIKTNVSKSAVENITMPTDPRIHTVSSSETLYSISRQYNIPLDTLKKINGLKDEDIKIGQTLVVIL